MTRKYITDYSVSVSIDAHNRCSSDDEAKSLELMRSLINTTKNAFNPHTIVRDDEDRIQEIILSLKAEWLDMEDTVADFTIDNPDTTVKITGQGANPKDVWQTVFRNGAYTTSLGRLEYFYSDKKKHELKTVLSTNLTDIKDRNESDFHIVSLEDGWSVEGINTGRRIGWFPIDDYTKDDAKKYLKNYFKK